MRHLESYSQWHDSQVNFKINGRRKQVTFISGLDQEPAIFKERN
jgi:hypothetical protein